MPINYKEDGSVKRPDKKIAMDQSMIMTLAKCAKDIEYFAEHFFHIVAKDGKQLIKLREYQKKLVKLVTENRFCILNIGRQSGKCLTKDSLITIKNKISGEEIEITLEDFFNMIEK